MDKRSAIWLLGGWLLMQPPYLATPRADGVIDLDAMRAESEAPLSQWSQVRAFDTARECEEARMKYYLEALKADKPTQQHKPNEVDDADRLRRAVCVPPSVVYPRPKP